MNRQKMLLVGLGLVGAVGLGAGGAQAALVTAVDANGLPIPNGPTVTILDTSSNPVADDRFPEPGVVYQLVETGNPSATFTLGSTPAYPNGYSSYPGTCTNTGSPTDTSPDFTLSGNLLTSRDCGGTVVVRDGANNTFVIPQDSDHDGMPDWWERLYCGGTNATCLNPSDDNEVLGTNPASGDGLASFDEYRGFIINGIHSRTNPTKKDLFVHLLNPQCPATGLSLVGRRTGETQTIYPTDGTSLLGNLPSLGGAATPVAYHFLTYQDRAVNGPSTEWTDYLLSYNVANPDFVFTTDPNGNDGRIEDRSINVNALYQKGVQHPTIPTRYIHKGVRLIECLDTNSGVVGAAFFPGSIQEGTPDSDTNSVVYTKRIYADYANLLTRASSKGTTSAYQTCALDPNSTCVYYSTYQNGAWTAGTRTYVDAATNTTKNVNRDYIVSKYIQYILAMELGHAVDLIPVIQITTYGPHYAPGTGDNLDQRVVAKDSKTLNGVLFQIPASFGDKSNAGFHLHP